MAEDDPIVERVELQGDEEVIARYKAMGAAGAQSMDEISAASKRTIGPLSQTAAAQEQFAASTSKAATSATAGAAATSALRSELIAEEIAARAAARATREAAREMDAGALSARTFGRGLSLIGRVARVRELTQMGRAVNQLSRGLAVLAVPVAAVVIERIANSAAKAAEKTTDLALAAGLSNEQFQEFTKAGAAAGVSQDEMSKGLEGVAKMLKEGANAEREFEDKLRSMNDRMKESGDKAAELVRHFEDFKVQIARTFADLAFRQQEFNLAGAASSESFVRSLRDIEEARDALNGKVLSKEQQKSRALRQLDEQEAEVRKKKADEDRKRAQEQIKFDREEADARKRLADETRRFIDESVKQDKEARDQRRERQNLIADFERNKTALQKLGITALDANGKLRQTPEVMADIADKLKELPPGLEKSKVEAELLAAGLSGSLIRALEGGAAAFEKLKTAGGKIEPPFTTEQIAVSRQFLIVSEQVGAALRALKNAFGLAIAPAFIGFMERMRDVFVEIRPGIEEFGRVLGGVLGPVMTAIASIIQNVIVPAIRGLFTILDLIAKKLNEAFGTQVTGMQIFMIVVLALAAAFASVPIAIIAVVTAVGLLLDAFKANQAVMLAIGAALLVLAIAFGGIGIAITAVIALIGLIAAHWGDITQGATGVVKELTDMWNAFVKFYNDLWAGAGKIVTDIIETTKNNWKTAIDAIVSFFQPLIDVLKKVWEVARQVGEALGIVGSGTGEAATVTAARGGFIRGPGTATSDSILARLSRGEFVIKAAAVEKYGLQRMFAINEMRMPKFQLPQFNMGGLVDILSSPLGPMPRLAMGGIADRGGAGGRPVILNIGGESFHLFTQEADTADRIGRYATKRRLSSAGRKPSYYGNGR